MRAILDSGPLIALWNQKDENHSWAKKLFSEDYSGPFHVTECVLTEVAHLTGRDRLIVETIKTGRFILEEGLGQTDKVDRFLEKFDHCDLADATVIALSERKPGMDVISTDRRHFVTYRRSDGSALPMVFPESE